MPSKPRRGLRCPSLTLSAALGLLACVGCTSLPQTPPLLTIPVAENLRKKCPFAEGADAVRTVGDLAAFSIQQEAALLVCEARREALVAGIDAHNALAAQLAQQPKRRFLGVF